MTTFRTRRLLASDEQPLNETYNRVFSSVRTGPPRSLDHMRWIWHQAPGGPADSWIIETQDRTGWRIIGHHALCPVFFTLGDERWLCGKTINTFLQPEFRDKFLYLRFERECLREADARFDATYSFAAGTARLRSALGYKNFGSWIQFERGFHSLHMMYRVMANLAGRISYSERLRLERCLASISEPHSQKKPLELLELSAAEAASSSFFADFWKEASRSAGMAPRRDSVDLEWRFWKNPGFKGATLTYTWAHGGRAYCVVDTANPLFYSLSDFFMTPSSPERLECLLEALFDWCARKGAAALKFLTVLEGQPPELMEVFLRKMKPFALQRYRPTFELPRRLSPLGKNRVNGALPDWNTTQFLVPG